MHSTEEASIDYVIFWFFTSFYSTGVHSGWGSTKRRTLEVRWMSWWTTATTFKIAIVCLTASLLTWWTATGWCTSSPNTEAGWCTWGLESTGAWETWEWVQWTWGLDPSVVSWTPVRLKTWKCNQLSINKEFINSPFLLSFRTSISQPGGSFCTMNYQHPTVSVCQRTFWTVVNAAILMPVSQSQIKTSSTYEICYVIYDALDIKINETGWNWYPWDCAWFSWSCLKLQQYCKTVSNKIC